MLGKNNIFITEVLVISLLFDVTDELNLKRQVLWFINSIQFADNKKSCKQWFLVAELCLFHIESRT
jgi:hypothetical protein